jgi:hypothetical protein
MNSFAAFRLPPVYRNLTSRCRPNQLGLRAGPSLYRYTNVGCYHLRNHRHPSAYNKLEVGNERNIVVDGTNSRYTGRGLFLLLDGIGETVSYLAARGTSGGGGSGDGALHDTLTFPPSSPCIEHRKYSHKGLHFSGHTLLNSVSRPIRSWGRDRLSRMTVVPDDSRRWHGPSSYFRVR